MRTTTLVGLTVVASLFLLVLNLVSSTPSSAVFTTTTSCLFSLFLGGSSPASAPIFISIVSFALIVITLPCIVIRIVLLLRLVLRSRSV